MYLNLDRWKGTVDSARRTQSEIGRQVGLTRQMHFDRIGKKSGPEGRIGFAVDLGFIGAAGNPGRAGDHLKEGFAPD